MQSSATTPYGLSPNIAMGLASLFGPIGAIVLLAARPENRDVRFIAIQSIVSCIAYFGLFIVLSVAEGIVGMLPGIRLIVLPVTLLLDVAISVSILAAWIVVTIRGFAGSATRLPIIAPYADRWV